MGWVGSWGCPGWERVRRVMRASRADEITGFGSGGTCANMGGRGKRTGRRFCPTLGMSPWWRRSCDDDGLAPPPVDSAPPPSAPVSTRVIVG